MSKDTSIETYRYILFDRTETRLDQYATESAVAQMTANHGCPVVQPESGRHWICSKCGRINAPSRKECRYLNCGGPRTIDPTPLVGAKWLESLPNETVLVAPGGYRYTKTEYYLRFEDGDSDESPTIWRWNGYTERGGEVIAIGLWTDRVDVKTASPETWKIVEGEPEGQIVDAEFDASDSIALKYGHALLAAVPQGKMLAEFPRIIACATTIEGKDVDLGIYFGLVDAVKPIPEPALAHLADLVQAIRDSGGIAESKVTEEVNSAVRFLHAQARLPVGEAE